MRKIVLAVALTALVGWGLGTVLYHFLISPTAPVRQAHIVSIRRGESLTTAARALAAAGVVRSAFVFTLYAQMSGQAARLKPGDYAFSGGQHLGEVLRQLVEGRFMVVMVTIPEGLTIHQIAQRLEQAGLVCASEFDDAARAGRIVRALGLAPPGAEGYLFPATYRFSPLEGTDQILATMLARFYATLTPQAEQRMFALQLNVRQLVTLASIVEKEAKVAGERPLIAGVFYNRLARAIPLQSDPTAQYNLQGEPQSALAAVHTASAFNTYSIAGLPPGPIANPGLSALKAALYPTPSDYLYFVARNDGTHIFSRSFQEHQRAIEEVRRTAARVRGQSGQPAAGAKPSANSQWSTPSS